MSKSERIYKVLMVTMIVATIGMLLAMGIIATQKSMKLNLSFNVEPTFLFEIYVEKDTQKYYVFRNFEADGKPLKFGAGIEALQGNKLSANSNFLAAYGNEFSIVIANYSSDKDLKVTMSSNATTTEGSGVAAVIEAVQTTALRLATNADANEAKFKITIPTAVFEQETFLEMQFEEFVYYTVSFNGNGNTTGEMKNELVSVNENFQLPANTFVRPGYEFEGWTVSPDGSGTVYADTQSIQNLVAAGGSVELYAKWDVASYSIKYNLDGGSVTAGSPTTHTYGTATQLKHAYKKGKIFAGWYTSSNYSGDPVESLGANEYLSDITLYAKWATSTNAINGLTFEMYNSGEVLQSGTSDACYMFKTTAGTYSSVGVEWIVLGGSLGGSLEEDYKGGSEVRIDGYTYIPNETLFLYSNYGDDWYATTKGFYINGEKAKTILLISRYVLMSTIFANSITTYYSESDLKNTMDSMATTLGLANTTMASKIKTTKIAKTSYGWNDGSEELLDLSFFPLGADTAYDKNTPIDSFNISKYFGTDAARVACSITSQKTPSSWWLRSGYGDPGSYIRMGMYLVNDIGVVDYYAARFPNGVRPAFVFNLA